MATDIFKTDLKLRFDEMGDADIDWTDDGIQTVDGVDNLAQALTLRLLVHRGELQMLGHSRYGSRIKELLGELMDRENLDLLWRYVRKALEADPRVERVIFLTTSPRLGAPGVVDINASVKAVTGEVVRLDLAMDFG